MQSHRDVGLLLLAPLVIAVVLGKLSVPAFASSGLGVTLPLVVAIAIVASAMNLLQVHMGRLIFFLLFVTWIAMAQLRGQTFSVASLVFLVVFHALYTLQIVPRSQTHDKEALPRAFGNLASIVAILGVVQFGLQFVYGVVWAFPIEHFLPSEFLIKNFNYLNPVSYGSKIYKSNGVFFLEPSFFSQFLALGILTEATFKTRLRRLSIMVVALVLSFSGTGLIALSAGMTSIAVVKKRFDLPLIFLALALILFSLDSVPDALKSLTERSQEFNSTGSSGFQRFVSWTEMFRDGYVDSVVRVFSGNGVGTFFTQSQVARYPVAEMSFSKALFEYGVPGALIYFAFLGYCIKSSEVATPVKVGMFACIFMNGAYSETMLGLMLTLFVWRTESSQLRPLRSKADRESAPISSDYFARNNNMRAI